MEKNMIQKTPVQTSISSGITISLVFGISLWVILLISNAKHLDRYAEQATKSIQLGPLLLTTISEKASDHGQIVSFTLGGGMVWYIGACIAIGALAGYILALRKRSRQKIEKRY